MMAADNSHLVVVQYLVEQCAALDIVNKVRAGKGISALLYYC